MKIHQPIIVWFRNDLRLHDHEPLFKAASKTEQVIPVCCIDPRTFRKSVYGFPKIGYWRARFLWESMIDLRESIRKIGSDLVLRVGHPEEVISQLAAEVDAQAVYSSKEVAQEEAAVENALEKKLWKQQKQLTLFWQSTLYRLDDLPHPLQNLPDIFTQFRKSVERKVPIRKQFPAPSQLLPHNIPSETLPTLASLGIDALERDSRAVLCFEGGETKGMERLNQYLWQGDQLKRYKETRNGLLGADYSSKLSPWLANGSLSPRMVYDQIKKYETERVKNQSTYWLYFELMWRDYFKFVAKKYGNRIFSEGGIKNEKIRRRNDQHKLDSWVKGQTGMPFIDANMKEIASSGYMSNRGRQNVASFLVKDLKVDWRLGAAYFEYMLVDYDVCSNWCNWNYVAGVGNDPRENRYFNILSQAKRYDPQGAYVKEWLPQLKALPDDWVHTAGKLEEADKTAYGVEYPPSLVPYQKWEK